MTPKRVGIVIKRARVNARLTLAQLGRHVKVSASFLCRLERGDRAGQPNDSVLRRLAKVLTLDADELFRVAGRVPADVEKWLFATPGAFMRVRGVMHAPPSMHHVMPPDLDPPFHTMPPTSVADPSSTPAVVGS